MKNISAKEVVISAQMSNPIDEAIVEGMKVIAKNNCTSCHLFNGEGTKMGPDLEMIAGISDLAAVTDFLRNPKQVRPTTAMQNVQLEDYEVDKIVAMFKAMRGANIEAVSETNKGFQIYQAQCLSCHRFNGEGGTFGPDLTTISSQMDDLGLKDAIINPPGGMPQFNLTEQDLNELVKFLLGNGGSSVVQTSEGLKIIKEKCISCHAYKGEGGTFGPDLTNVSGKFDATNLGNYINNPAGGMPPMGLAEKDLEAVVSELLGESGSEKAPTGTEVSQGDADNGKKILQVKCLSCHAFDGGGGTFGPDLTNAKAKFDVNSIKEYINNPQGGMPPMGLPEDELSDLAALLIGVTAAVAPSENHDEGIKIVKEKCLSCHAVNNEGGTFAPNLTEIGLKMDINSLAEYMNNPVGGMTPMGLSDGEASKVAKYLHSLTVKQTGTANANATKIVQPGENIYKSHACSSCHVINGKGGTFGPDLSKIGKKDRQWLVDFMKNPPAKMAITPLSKKEIDDVVDYMMTLK